jgi:hypothetical protein
VVAANTPPEICGLLVFAQAVGPAALVTIISGDCDINDAYLRYDDFDPTEVRQRLAELGIVIRESDLPRGSAASGLTPLT